jgi:hypothetical protein
MITSFIIPYLGRQVRNRFLGHLAEMPVLRQLGFLDHLSKRSWSKATVPASNAILRDCGSHCRHRWPGSFELARRVERTGLGRLALEYALWLLCKGDISRTP